MNLRNRKQPARKTATHKHTSQNHRHRRVDRRIGGRLHYGVGSPVPQPLHHPPKHRLAETTGRRRFRLLRVGPREPG